MNASRTSRRALIALAATTLLSTSALAGSATAVPGTVIDLPLIGCTGTQVIHSGTYTIESRRNGAGNSTGYCHWEANAPAGTRATGAWVSSYDIDYRAISTGSRTLYINGAGNCWGAGRFGDGVAYGSFRINGFDSHGACIVMAQDRDFRYGRAIYTTVGHPRMAVQDMQGPSASAPRLSSPHVTNGWIRPANQPSTAPAGPVAAAPAPMTINVEWDSADNEAWRGDTGVTVGEREINIGNQPNGTHRVEVSVTERTPISAWRVAPEWPTASSAPRTAMEFGVRVDGTPPSLGAPSATWDQGAERIRATWSADDANGDGGSGLAWSELQIARQGTTAWTALERVTGGKPTRITPDTGRLDEGTYTLRVVARDTAGNWQVLPVGTITISRPPAPAAGGAGSPGNGSPAPGSAAGSNGKPATMSPAARARQTRYSIMAMFEQGNARKTTLRAARRGVMITGELLDGYEDPVVNTEIRIQQSGRVWKTTTNEDGEFTIRVTTRIRGVLGATADNVRRPMRLYVR